MIEFKIVSHSFAPTTKIVEVRIDKKVVGVIYPTAAGIKIVSAHFSDQKIDDDFAGEVIQSSGQESWPPIPSVAIEFKPSPYIIDEHGQIVKIPEN